MQAMLAEVKSASRRTRVSDIARAAESTRRRTRLREGKPERPPEKVAFLFESICLSSQAQPRWVPIPSLRSLRKVTGLPGEKGNLKTCAQLRAPTPRLPRKKRNDSLAG